MPVKFVDSTELSAALKKDLGFSVEARSLSKFAESILQANAKFNLTAHEDSKGVYTSLFYDALAPYKPEDFVGSLNVIDVGSGSGVPGLLLKLAFRNINLTVLEASVKKVAFIDQTARDLGLEDVQVICSRAEIVPDSFREKFDVATARAVASLPILLELLAPYVKVGGKVICPKSRRYFEEISLCDNAIAKLGLEPPQVRSFISTTGIEHNVPVFIKVRPTPAEFPRK